jgi:serine protease Do
MSLTTSFLGGEEDFMKKRIASLIALVMICMAYIPLEAFSRSVDKIKNATTLDSLSSSIAKLAQKVHPSIVQIRTTGYSSAEGQEIGLVSAQRGIGSGVILDSTGYIVTNAHVVKGARYIEVWLDDSALASEKNTPGASEKRSVAATLVGADFEADLAVIKIERTGLVPLTLADSDTVRQGQVVLAFGSPMAMENSLSMGVISSVERQIGVKDPVVYIQTDAPINPGNSGGALVDTQGRLIGINTLILSQSGGNEGLGFAIPSNTVQKIYKDICSVGHTHHGRIGIQPLTITPSLAAGLQLSRDWGVLVEDVEPEGPADKAGLQPGDLILTIDAVTTRNIHQFFVAVDRHEIGDMMKITVRRGTENIEASVVVEERADDPNRFFELVSTKANLVSRLGILALDLNEKLLDLMPDLRKPAGVIVAAGIAGTPDLGSGSLAPGDLLISLNGKPIANIESLRAILADIKSGSPAVLQIQRDDQLKYIVLELP